MGVLGGYSPPSDLQPLQRSPLGSDTHYLPHLPLSLTSEAIATSCFSRNRCRITSSLTLDHRIYACTDPKEEILLGLRNNEKQTTNKSESTTHLFKGKLDSKPATQ